MLARSASDVTAVGACVSRSQILSVHILKIGLIKIQTDKYSHSGLMSTHYMSIDFN